MVLKVRLGGGTPAGYVLLHEGRRVGWVRSGVIGFDGFADRRSALEMAQIANAALAQWHAERQQPVGEHAPDSWRRGLPGDDHLLLGGAVTARVLDAHEVPIAGAESCGFEIALPPATWLAVMLQLAQRIHADISARSTRGSVGEATEAGSLA